MNKEKVIKALELALDKFRGKYEHFKKTGIVLSPRSPVSDDVELIKSMENALELLKAQEPVKPNFCGYYQCGVCGADIGHSYEANYCPKCGRAVKWE